MSKFDEIDLALLDGLHVNPRATFGDLARVLDISGATVARRWRQLVDDGTAWVSSAFGSALSLAGGLLEAECEPGRARAVTDRLAAFPHVFSVHVTTGRYNVYALVAAADQAMLARLLIDVLPTVPGIRAVRTAMAYQMFSGTYWRLGAISTAQANEVAPPPSAEAPRRFDDFDRRLFLALQHDGRLSYRDLSATVHCSEVVARRRVQFLVRSGMLRFRTDFARVAAGWPISTVMILGVGPGTAVADIGRTLVGWPETRVCAAVFGGTSDLFVTTQVHHVSALDDFSYRLHREFPEVNVLDRRLTLRAVKSYGRVLDDNGYARAVVPVDPWADV